MRSLPTFVYSPSKIGRSYVLGALHCNVNMHLSLPTLDSRQHRNRAAVQRMLLSEQSRVEPLSEATDVFAGLVSVAEFDWRGKRDRVVGRHAVVRNPRLDGLFQISIQSCIAHCSPRCYWSSQRYLSARFKKRAKSLVRSSWSARRLEVLRNAPNVVEVSRTGEINSAQMMRCSNMRSTESERWACGDSAQVSFSNQSHRP